eukprot:TRINITY_DN619_c0_g1_i4.p1 TRINITY_DN619_c0_g1~~TRINITY_DN619_c0_g1_i4.p1  ORF type:complete len:385 (-),score=34.04 TRINITY_DN619_c0_g1_i4:73-1059(-)
MPLVIGFAGGCGFDRLSSGSRVSLPVAPISKSESKQAPIVDDGIYPVPFFIPGNRVCGAARCHPGDLCCPAAPGFGFACGARESVCCQGNRGSIVCAANGQCCRNSHGASYCCAEGNFCEAEVCVAQQGTHCFPGHATVNVKGSGRTAMRDVRLDDEVLVKHPDNTLAYEAVQGFVHAVRNEEAEHLVVRHEQGELHLSANHIVFVAGEARGERLDKAASAVAPGDVLTIPENKATSQVLSVRRDSSSSGMFAPLTASGNLVVDGVTASTYAVASLDTSVQHAAVHASFFHSRVHARLGQLHSRWWQTATASLLHAAFVMSIPAVLCK